MPKARERKWEQTGRGNAWSTTMLGLLRGGVVGFTVACGVLGGAALLIYFGVFGNGNADSAAVAACLFGGFAGGVFAVKKGRIAPLLLGLGAGGVLYLMLFAAGALLYDAAPRLSSAGVIACACLCGGGLSGFMGRSGKSRRRQ